MCRLFHLFICLGPNLADMQPTILFKIYASQISSLWPMGPVFVAAMSSDPIVLSTYLLCLSSIDTCVSLHHHDGIKKALGGSTSDADLIKLLSTNGFLGFYLGNRIGFVAIVKSYVNSKFMEGSAACFRLQIAVKEEGPLGFYIERDKSENSVRVKEVNDAINKSVQMLRPGDILIPEEGTHENRFTFDQFRREAIKTRRPALRFDAITK